MSSEHQRIANMRGGQPKNLFDGAAANTSEREM